MTPKQVQDYLRQQAKSRTVKTNGGILLLFGIAKIVGMAVYPEFTIPGLAIANLLLRQVTEKPIRDL